MDWLTQNWVWILLGLGAVWMFSRGGLAGCGMGGHGGHGGHGGGTGPAPGGTPPGGGGTMRNQDPASGANAEKAIDPVSGHEVLTAQALTAAYQGRIFYFESPENRQRFEAAPQQYSPNAAPAPQQHRHHGCC